MKVIFRSEDVKDESGERIFYEIDIDSLTINGQRIIDDSITVTYAETYEYIRDIKQDETICISVSWHPHEWAVHKIAKLSHND